MDLLILLTAISIAIGVVTSVFFENRLVAMVTGLLALLLVVLVLLQ